MFASPGGLFFVRRGTICKNFKLKVAPILIRTGSWIAMASLILSGATIGEGVVVSAGSVALKDVPANCLVRGNPATFVREIFRGPESPKPSGAARAARVRDKSTSRSTTQLTAR
jgi:serine acetyltransferase